ncbi:MAG: hypothetical protein ACFFCP_08710 [Promethearchaeota archaeon]
MIIPGTTISLTLLPTYIEVRDKGMVKKKIPLKDRSFDDVALELQKYVRYLGKRLAPGVLEDILDKIGLPKARRVLKEEPVSPKTPELEAIAAKPTKKQEEPAATFVESPGVSADEKGEISVEDFDDISDALEAVEALSDSFMAGESIEEKEKETAKAVPKISIQLEGQEEILASNKTYARVAESEIPVETAEEDTGEEMVELIAETVEEESPEVEPEEVSTEPTPMVTPAHQIKPIVECKALLLGEDGVGKESLKAKAEIVPITDDYGEMSTYIFGRVFDGSNHRIDLRIWSFDLAVKAKVQRRQFYSDSQVIIIVYSASDRWSFESIDFWLREATLSSEAMPPLLIVANKIDLRTETTDDSGDQPVSYDEGFQLAEELAKRFGTEDKLHPVAFIETSCVTLEGVEEAFKTAVQLFENTL